MNLQVKLIGIALVLLMCLVHVARGAEPSTKPVANNNNGAAGAPEFVVTDLRVLQSKPRPYLYAEITTSYAEMKPHVEKLMADLHQVMLDANVRPTAPPIFVYRGAAKDMNRPFQLQVGIPVPDGTKDVGDFRVRTLEPMRSATVVFSGPMANIGSAYEQAFQQLFMAGLQPTGETREQYLLWEGGQSPNNVILIGIGVK
jgi:hypothetical protein